MAWQVFTTKRILKCDRVVPALSKWGAWEQFRDTASKQCDFLSPKLKTSWVVGALAHVIVEAKQIEQSLAKPDFIRLLVALTNCAYHHKSAPGSDEDDGGHGGDDDGDQNPQQDEAKKEPNAAYRLEHDYLKKVNAVDMQNECRIQVMGNVERFQMARDVLSVDKDGGTGNECNSHVTTNAP